jgi:hypothetical protein
VLRLTCGRHGTVVNYLISTTVYTVKSDGVLRIMEGDQDLCIGSVYVFGAVALPNMLLPGANHYT